MTKKALLLREEPFQSSRKGVKIVHFPIVKIKKLWHQVPRSKFDAIIVTSANTCRFLSFWPEAEKIICVGPKTKDQLPKALKKKAVCVEPSSSEGILKYLRGRSPQKIFFPRSQIADPRTVKSIRKQKHSVLVRHVYTTRSLMRRKALLALLGRSDIENVLITSPSVFKALKKNISLRLLKTLDLKFVSIGETSAKYLKSFGISSILSSKPKLEAMLRKL